MNEEDLKLIEAGEKAGGKLLYIFLQSPKVVRRAMEYHLIIKNAVEDGTFEKFINFCREKDREERRSCDQELEKYRTVFSSIHRHLQNSEICFKHSAGKC